MNAIVPAGLGAVILYAGVPLVALIVIGIVMARLYRRASKEIAFVRTGFGGEKVVMNGGALVLPVLHETMPVNMNTVRLAVERRNGDALITLDRLRIDVRAEFYVRVRPDREALATAAQTLGQRTMNPEALKELVEGKFVDALRSVAAGMTMNQLHEQRSEFVQKVQQVSSADLAMNGLELESVSLTGLDQTSIEHFNANNAFDAEGLTKLTEQIELRKKARNDIEQDTRVQIEAKNLEASRTSFTIARDAECPGCRGDVRCCRNCRHYDECFVMRARKQALEADVVVVNHHLFFADLVLRDGDEVIVLTATDSEPGVRAALVG